MTEDRLSRKRESLVPCAKCNLSNGSKLPVIEWRGREKNANMYCDG